MRSPGGRRPPSPNGVNDPPVDDLRQSCGNGVTSERASQKVETRKRGMSMGVVGAASAVVERLRRSSRRGADNASQLSSGSNRTRLQPNSGQLEPEEVVEAVLTGAMQPVARAMLAGEGPAAFDVIIQMAQRLLPPSGLSSVLSQALCVAAEAGVSHHVSLLLAANADAYVCDAEHYTPLMLAAEAGSIASVRILLGSERAADSLQLVHPHSQLTALGLACCHGELAVVADLLHAGAHVTAAVVAHAVACGHARLVPHLVRASEWHKRGAESGLQVQRHLRLLDPYGKCSVKKEMLTDAFTMETSELVGAFVHGFRLSPHEAFSDAVFLADCFRSEAAAVRMRDRFRADQLMLQSVRVQHVACGLLRSLYRTNPDFVDVFLAAEPAMRTIRAAVVADCKVLLAQTEVQTHLQWRWRGLCEGGTEQPPVGALRLLGTPFMYLAAALYPPLWTRYRLLPSPRARFYQRAISDVMLSAVLLVMPPLVLPALGGTPSSHGADSSDVRCSMSSCPELFNELIWCSAICVWAVGGLLSEFRELEAVLAHSRPGQAFDLEVDSTPATEFSSRDSLLTMLPQHSLLRPHNRSSRQVHGGRTVRRYSPPNPTASRCSEALPLEPSSTHVPPPHNLAHLALIAPYYLVPPRPSGTRCGSSDIPESTQEQRSSETSFSRLWGSSKDVCNSGSRTSPVSFKGPAPPPRTASKDDQKMCELSEMSEMSSSRPCSGSRWTSGVLPSVGEYQQQHAPRLVRRNRGLGAASRPGGGSWLRQLCSWLLELRRPRASLHGMRLSATLQRYDYRRSARAATRSPRPRPHFHPCRPPSPWSSLLSVSASRPYLRSHQVEPPCEEAHPGCYAAARRSGHPRDCGACPSEVQPL